MRKYDEKNWVIFGKYAEHSKVNLDKYLDGSRNGWNDGVVCDFAVKTFPLKTDMLNVRGCDFVVIKEYRK